MNTREYIESGILEAYILGALSPEEEKLVEANIALFPELGDELLEIETAMQKFSASQAMTPPAGLQDKIWHAIQSSRHEANKEENNPFKKGTNIRLQPAYKQQQQWKYAAIWIALVGSLAVNMLLWYQGNHEKEEKAALNTKVNKLESDQQLLASQLADYQKAKNMMADTGMQTIVMHTIQKGHPMAAMLYWSKSNGEAYVAMNALPAPPPGMQYQLWAMQGGKPVDMGVLPNNMANTPEVQKVTKPITAGEAFAISLEKEGGSPTPTMQNIYVMGKPS